MGTAPAADFTSWETQPQATALVTRWLESYVEVNSWLAALRDRLERETGTRLFDWIDTIHVPEDEDLAGCGFTLDDPFNVVRRAHHPGAQLPWVVPDGRRRVVLRIESVVDFLRAQSFTASSQMHGSVDIQTPIRGVALASRRSAVVSESDGVQVAVVERHGDGGDVDAPQAAATVDSQRWHHWVEQMRLRPRHFEDPVSGIETTIELASAAVADLGRDRACDLFFRTEREFWQLRNRAAANQYEVQSRLGLGWANHDHHTYRSSRRGFAALVRLLETLGMHCRERFYAGADAGWGAQVLEQPAARIVVFADVDMSADEVLGDFAHEGLPDVDHRGTVGLWCHLHGEAVLEAGMHHLECQFDFQRARERLAAEGTTSLEPFSDFPYLKQSFTRGEVWPVDPRRIETALRRGWITEDQARRFVEQGVTGSHLEVLQRDDGYKGFNQTGISDIIARTDPRNAEMR